MKKFIESRKNLGTVIEAYESFFVDLRLIDADATGSARRADAAANFREAWMDYGKRILSNIAESMFRTLQKAAVQRGARGCCPSRTRSTEWVWVYR